MATTIIKLFITLYFTFSFSSTLAVNSSSTTNLDSSLSSIRNFCRSTPYPDACFDSLKLSISINISPNILNYLLQTLDTALSEAGKLTNAFSDGGKANDIVEKQRGTMQDCKELHEITLSSLKKSVSRIKSGDSKQLPDARSYLSAALTNKNTCLEGLDSASGSFKPVLVNSLGNIYKHVSNSLSMIPKSERRRDEYDPSEVITVAADGTGNFSTINDAISFAPNNSDDRVIIYVKGGVYEENVEIPSYKTNIVLLGDGNDATFITGNRSVVDGWTTFRSATLAVSGEGFLARDITIENTAGPAKHQAVALRVNADFAALYKCSINGYQDTLYAHSFRQFYRECDISGTIDYIFGNAVVIFQACNIITRMPMARQFTVITAQSRDTPDENTGISIQNCSILATDELPSGWTKWSKDEGLDTLYYGEYGNYGPGSETENRVDWTGYHVMEIEDAYNFTLSELITGEAWLDSTGFPYDAGI
ncbi:putative pectinesterase/pectinesterase inhibitor 12 [Hibiscus syriacus]|uniref:Pectinesterase n=1 Tax=Hibiscus syriacus TaxID=106335 RepID=A0A6A2ZB05_HIBSY|nr:putative pectinesterase/pectinesterase inhibitor 12 [Hibiscus syriacus]